MTQRHLVLAMGSVVLPCLIWLAVSGFATLGAAGTEPRSETFSREADTKAGTGLQDERTFDQTLHDGYVLLARQLSQSDKTSVNDIVYFQNKALASGRGERPEPEALEVWSIPEPEKTRLAKTRDRLMRLRAHTAQVASPEVDLGNAGQLASLQIQFDCHVIAAEALAAGKIFPCAAGLVAALERLEAQTAGNRILLALRPA